MSPRAPFKMGDTFGTTLDPLNEMAFRQWVTQNQVPFNVNAAGPSDYDMRDYYQGVMQGNPMARPTEINVNDGLPHYTDYYKTPLHQSFSSGSQWADETTPSWINDKQLVSPGGRIVFDEGVPRPDPQSIQALVNVMLGRK